MRNRPDPLPVEPLDGPVDATIVLPGSKSITNRALVCAALAGEPSELHGALDADDTQAMIECLGHLGVVAVFGDDGVLRVVPGGAEPDDATIDARQSGTTARFLLPVLALGEQPRVLDGDPQLRARPMGPAFDAIAALGGRVEPMGEPGHLPAAIGGPIAGGVVRLSGDVSSQFLSGLLLAAPAATDELVVALSTELVSRPYVDMTLAVQRAFGARVDHRADDTEEAWAIQPGGYRGTRYDVEPDASAASYAWAAAAVTGGRVTVPGLHRGSLQGDVAFVDVLEQMGCTVAWHDDAVAVTGPRRLRGVDVDLAAISDTVPTFAVVAALADGPSRVRGVGFIRDKESDRIAGPVAELRRCGVDARESDDGFEIRPGRLRPATISTYRDHRMAMAFGVLGLVAEGIEILDPTCVAKTFPAFWDLLDDLRAGSLPPARAV